MFMAMSTSMFSPLVPMNVENAVMHSVTGSMVDVISQAPDFREQVLDEMGMVLYPLLVMSETWWEIDLR